MIPEKRRFTNGSGGLTVESSTLQAAYGSVARELPGATGSFSNGQCRWEFRRGCDRLVVHLLDRSEDQHNALIGIDAGKRLLEDSPQILPFQVLRRIITIALFQALETGSNLVLATSRPAPRQMEAPMFHRGANQERTFVGISS